MVTERSEDTGPGSLDANPRLLTVCSGQDLPPLIQRETASLEGSSKSKAGPDKT